MPGNKIPVELSNYSEDWNNEENYKSAESVSSRSSSPRTSWTSSPISVSEASESPEGSVISETETEEDRIANDLDNMKITEIQAEEMMKEGVDMRHVLKEAYLLKPKFKKFNKGTKLNGKAVMSLLNFDNYKEKEEDYEQKQRMNRAWAQYEQRQNKGKGVRPPPGFNSLDKVIAEKFKEDDDQEYIVSYANGTNSLSLASDPIVVHDITVSCVVDSCRVFIQHMKNPTFASLSHLETELLSTYTMEQAKPLLRPIAMGSVLAVFSDNKYYRCQVTSYNSKEDTCDIKFVDHGGYTTVPATDLRQLKSQFLRLPFQAVEVYLAHVNPSDEENTTDIAANILFAGDVSIKLLGSTDDGLPMIQAYFYNGDYINIFTQETIDCCKITSLTPSETSEDDIQEQSPVPEEEVILPYDEPVYPSYPYYCPETGYTHYSSELPLSDPTSLTQPTICSQPIAYCYIDPEGMQQFYYVTGPYILPTETPDLQKTEDPTSSSSSSEDSSEISFGFSNDSDTQSSNACSSPNEEENLLNKPFEEWTQEDYAIYYSQ